MEIIAANRGVRFLNQPLEILTPNLTPSHYRRLPKFDDGQIVHPDAQQVKELRAFVGELLSGRFPANAPHRFWRREFDFRATRLVLKIVGAKAMIDWFDENFDIQVVFLVRHPIAQALSCLRNGWAPTTGAYLRNSWFADEVLGRELWAAANEVTRVGSDLEKLVLNWIVENLYPLRRLPAQPQWFALSYEECVSYQEEMLALIADRLALSDLKRMARAAARESRSAGFSEAATRAAIRAGRAQNLADAWVRRIDAEEQGRCFELLERFGITLYRPGSPMPNWAGYRQVSQTGDVSA